MHKQFKQDNEYIVTNDDKQTPRFRVMGSAPYNQAWMNDAIAALNEFSALREVEQAVRFAYGDGLVLHENLTRLTAALAKLDEIRRG